MDETVPAELPILVATVGLPRSGKTTWAHAASKDHGWPVVNPDAIRLAIHGQRFVASAEPFVWATAKAMVRALHLAGHRAVILDATNVSRKRRDEWKSSHWRTLFTVLDATAETCKDRANQAGDLDILPVIDRMAAEWESLGPDESRVEILGATGAFPDGHYGTSPDEDEGELRVVIGADTRAGIVRIHFGKLLSWVGLPKAGALEFAETIRRGAARLP